ncbi:hypothetical protein SYNPS1DRAFT_29425 [Syncephalis pseudoplumigaleata]|uniref:F-box domain-containing protein n=1 Tax=Syncephalis pseudoplumigaleata TaxID=1712513 RepID=A0A4P9YY39_9FUNG|nr:hypothetical protein SYNPS1DRAFT_29425 [Syncephalis pseudoplumigaleata]|eukprot:RKP24825.1 hypothetical protein SYNPS1DRAFT_29425 [Syncephalis pseudoplumigaleata]
MTIVGSSIRDSPRTPVDLLATLPYYERDYLLSLLGHTGLMRLSACCRSWRSIICDDTALWKGQYKRAFLSGAYRDKEWEFVLWCLRTDAGDGSAPIRRADLLGKDIDWYNVYRRRVTTENNWRHDRASTIEMDAVIERDQHMADYRYSVHSTSATGAVVSLQHASNATQCPRYYSLEFSSQPSCTHAAGANEEHSLFAAPNATLLDDISDVERQKFRSITVGDHYMFARHGLDDELQHTITIRARGHNSMLDTISIAGECVISGVSGKWALATRRLDDQYEDDVYIGKIIDLERAIKHTPSFGGLWNAACIYEADDDSVVVYTARMEDGEKAHRLDWVLHRLSGDDGALEQFRTGWLYLPDLGYTELNDAHAMSNAQVVITIEDTNGGNVPSKHESTVSTHAMDIPHYPPVVAASPLARAQASSSSDRQCSRLVAAAAPCLRCG